jgi:hypothetical protein
VLDDQASIQMMLVMLPALPATIAQVLASPRTDECPAKQERTALANGTSAARSLR